MILTTNNLRTADGTESTHGIFECNVCNAVKYHDEGLFMSCPVSPGHRVSTGRGVDPIFATVDRLKALRGTFVFKAFEFMGGEHVTLTAHFLNEYRIFRRAGHGGSGGCPRRIARRLRELRS